MRRNTDTKRRRRERMAQVIANEVRAAIAEAGFRNPGWMPTLQSARSEIERFLRDRIEQSYIGNELIRIATPRR